MIRGYGSCHVPLSAGTHGARIPIFRPESSSLLQRLAGWVTGRRPEFVDPRVAASGEGRDVTRVSTNGSVRLSFSVISKDLRRLGYEAAPRGKADANGGGGSEIRNRGPSDGLGLVAKDGGGGRRRSGKSGVEDMIAEEEGDGGEAAEAGGSGVVEV